MEWALHGSEDPPPASYMLEPVIFLRSLFHLAGGDLRGPPMAGPGVGEMRAFCRRVDSIGDGEWPAEA